MADEQNNFSFTRPLAIVCEGPDDQRFYETLIKKRALPAFQVIPSIKLSTEQKTGGLNGIKQALKVLKSGAITSLENLKLLVLAADNDAEKDVLGELKKALKANGFDAPRKAGKIKASSTDGLPAIAIVLIPIEDRGDLETLCKKVLFKKWPTAGACIDAFLTCTGAYASTPAWTKSNLDKARIHAAITGYNKKDPEKTLKDCFQSTLVDLTCKEFDSIANTVKALGEGI